MVIGNHGQQLPYMVNVFVATEHGMYEQIEVFDTDVCV